MDENIKFGATLECGARVDVVQYEPGMILEFTITPKPGIDISDTADFKDGKLRIRMTEESMIGMYQIMRLILFPKPVQKRKTAGESFLDGLLGR